VNPYLPTVTRLGILEAEAGNRAQSEMKLFITRHINHRTWKVFNKETKLNKGLTTKLIRKAFPTVSSSEKKYVNVKGNKSPFDGDLPYWSERSKFYNGHTSKALKRQNHSCASCGHQLLSDERVHLHHIDGNHDNWKRDNLAAIHESCHDYIHMSKAKV
jgi:RNA-directed DNA polymerase